jgi:ABC-type Fe3+-hydroxamate transport system substrate-binding protein
MRIVSLCPSLTELVARLGRGADLVGATTYCVAPAAVVEHVPKVGGTKNPDVARIAALAPDLVLLNREENRREDAEALLAHGLRLHTSLPRDVEGARNLVLELGALLERRDAAHDLVAEIDAAVARADAARSAASTTFVCLVWRKPWMAVDRGTYLSRLVESSGGLNLVAAAEGTYPPITARELAELAPQRVLLPDEPFPFAAKHVAELAAVTGLDPSVFRLVDGAALTWHGARTAHGIDVARAALWGS